MHPADRQALMPAAVLPHLRPDENAWLVATFSRYQDRYPTLEELWQLMDEAWQEERCDQAVMDARVDRFYAHPVWLLNGLFIEQHQESLDNRRQFTAWVARQRPKRVADYGGGFGTLARMIGEACPEAEIQVIEPHPHLAAVALAEETRNVRYETKLQGEYDILIATDVFEHVPDPLAVVAQTSAFLRPSGQYLIANCFHPVILCHLPHTFHFLYSWDAVLSAMGLKWGEVVCYGSAYRRSTHIDPGQGLRRARAIERRSRLISRWQHRIPGRLKPWVFNTLKLSDRR